RIVLQCGKGRDHDNGAGALLSHDRDDVLASHDGAAQIDSADPVESLFGEIEQRRIAAGNADTDVVMQNIYVAPTLLRRRYRRGERCFLGDVGFEGDAFAASLPDHRHRILGRREITVHGHHFGTLLGESQSRGAAIAHPFTWALPGANNDGGLSFKTHGGLPSLLAANEDSKRSSVFWR